MAKISEVFDDLVDFEEVRKRSDLRKYIERDLNQQPRRGRYVCPFHADAENANLSVGRDKVHWKCFQCGEHGDIFDWIALREGITVAEAARQLDPWGMAVTKGRGTKRPAPEPTSRPSAAAVRACQDAAWQGAVERIIADAEAALWSAGGRPALNWLRSRGLADHTIARFRLGFIPGDTNSDPLEILGRDGRGRARTIWARRGITIPWCRPGGSYGPREWVGCNVRRLPIGDPDGPIERPKYQALAGSERGHAYPWPDFAAPGVPAIVCEGEIDALTAWQEAGWVANVLTIGGAKQSPQPEAVRVLAACPDLLLMFDHDAAGDVGAREFGRRFGHKSRRLWLPGGDGDLNDYHKAGGDVLAWLAAEWARFGWPWPLRAAAR